MRSPWGAEKGSYSIERRCEAIGSMAKKWDPHKGRWTMRRLVKEKVEEAGPNGLPIEDLATALRNDGYYIPSTRQLIKMLPRLKLTLDPDGETVHLKVL